MNRDEYQRMYEHEQTLWWYVGMRAIAGVMIERSLNAQPAVFSSRQPASASCQGLPASGDRSLALSLETHAGASESRPKRHQLPARRGKLEILDAGCGTGAGLEWLARYGRATGLDLSEDALALSQQRGLRRLVRGSVDQLPFPDESFDLVTSFDVLYHLWVADASQAMREFHRVLRPGGRLLLRLPALSWLQGRHDVAVHTRHRYRLEEVLEELTHHGFVVEQATYVNALLLPLVAGKRLLERWSSDAPGDLDATPPWLNRLLTSILRFEARLVTRRPLPLGVSIMAVGRRPA